MLVDLISPENARALFTLFQAGLIGMGFYCASLLTKHNPLWARLVVLVPSFSGLIGVAMALQQLHVPTWYEAMSSGSVLALYLLIIFGRKWLAVERRYNPDGSPYDRRLRKSDRRGHRGRTGRRHKD